MKRGFVTNELLIAVGLFATLFGFCLPISQQVGWGVAGAFPLTLIALFFGLILANSRKIIGRLRGKSNNTTSHPVCPPQDERQPEHRDTGSR